MGKGYTHARTEVRSQDVEDSPDPGKEGGSCIDGKLGRIQTSRPLLQLVLTPFGAPYPGPVEERACVNGSNGKGYADIPLDGNPNILEIK